MAYRSNSQEHKPTSTPNKSLHTRRFKYGINEKVDLKKIEYPDLSQIGYFANKEKVRQEQVEKTSKNKPTDKRIILELKRSIKALEKKNKKLDTELILIKERLLREGGMACCC